MHSDNCMRTEHMFVIWSYIRINPTSSFSTDRSKAVPLLQFFYIRALLISYVVFAFPLFAPSLNCQGGRVVSTPDFGLRGPRVESKGK